MLARVVIHVLARVLLHVLARVIIHVHDYYSKTCVPGAYSARFVKNCEPWNTPKKAEKGQKRVKKLGDVTFMKEWVKALDDTRILAPADLKNLEGSKSNLPL